MANKKLIALLSSVAAGVGLVGATFALYAVTDNANPFGIKISPGNITENITYDTLTLDWGDTAKFAAVSNLEMGTAQYRYVEVQATSSKVGDVSGNFSARLVDQTERAVNYNGDKLIDFLQVSVYEVENTSTQPANNAEALFTLDGDNLTGNHDITVPNGSPAALAFKVLLPAEGLDGNKYNTIKNDIVYLEIDWNKTSSTAEVQGDIIYYTGSRQNDFTPIVYAWGATSNNGDFGAVANRMTLVGNGVYSYVLSDNFTNVIFIYGREANEGAYWQTGDIEITETIRSDTPMYTYSEGANHTAGTGSWTALSLVENGYYLTGTKTGWSVENGVHLVDPVDGVYTTTVTVSAEESAAGGVDFKIIQVNDGVKTFFGEYNNIDGTPNFHLGEAGTYTVTFSPSKNIGTGGDAYIFASKN